MAWSDISVDTVLFAVKRFEHVLNVPAKLHAREPRSFGTFDEELSAAMEYLF